jgi:hypothetical protein
MAHMGGACYCGCRSRGQPVTAHPDAFKGKKGKQPLKAQDQKSQKTRAYSLDEKRKQHPRAYERWTAEEDARLQAAFTKATDELAAAFGRQPSAIRARLRKLLE